MRKLSRKKKLIASVCTVLLGLGALGSLSGCSGVANTLGVVTNTDPTVELTSTLPEGSTITDGTLTVGVNANNTPYGGTNSNGQVIGLDVDLAASLADSLGCKVNIVDVGTNGKDELKNGSVDAVMGTTMTGSSKTVSYSSAYLNDGVSLFCLVQNMPESVEKANLTKGKVIVQASTSAALEMQDALSVDSIVITSTMQEAFDALENGDATYLAANAVIGDYYARNYSDISRVDYLSANDVTPIYVATAASNTELSSAVNQAMTSITSDGTLSAVSSKWVGDQASTLLPGSINVDDLPKTFSPGKTTK